MIQGYRNVYNGRTYKYKKSIPLAGQTTAVCGIGDIIENESHITLVLGTNDAKSSYLVAEAVDDGVRIAYYKYNDKAYSCKIVDYQK